MGVRIKGDRNSRRKNPALKDCGVEESQSCRLIQFPENQGPG